MLLRVLLLFGISCLVAMSIAFLPLDLSWLKVGVTGQSIIMLAGGIFLLIKSVQEIHHKVEGLENHDDSTSKKGYTIRKAIIQITIINRRRNDYRNK